MHLSRNCLYLRLFCSFLLVQGLPTLCAEENFKSGDYFNYDIYWSFLKVGNAQLAFEQISSDDAPKTIFEISFSVESNALIQTIYPVQSTVKSRVCIEEMKPLLYTKNQHEGEETRALQIQFNWDNNESITTKNNTETNTLSLEPNTLDPLSLILAISNHDFINNDSQFIQKVSDGGSIVSIEANYKNQKVLHTKSGSFESNKIEVATKELKGVFNKSPDSELFLFMSQDNPAVLLKLQSKVVVGSFIALFSDGVYQGVPLSRPDLRPKAKKRWTRGRFK